MQGYWMLLKLHMVTSWTLGDRLNQINSFIQYTYSVSSKQQTKRAYNCHSYKFAEINPITPWFMLRLTHLVHGGHESKIICLLSFQIWCGIMRCLLPCYMSLFYYSPTYFATPCSTVDKLFLADIWFIFYHKHETEVYCLFRDGITCANMISRSIIVPCQNTVK